MIFDWAGKGQGAKELQGAEHWAVSWTERIERGRSLGSELGSEGGWAENSTEIPDRVILTVFPWGWNTYDCFRKKVAFLNLKLRKRDLLQRSYCQF